MFDPVLALQAKLTVAATAEDNGMVHRVKKKRSKIMLLRISFASDTFLLKMGMPTSLYIILGYKM